MSFTPNQEIKSQSFSSEEVSEESSQFSKNGDLKSNLPLKKKRIVRKKYKPRKKDVFIHTICVLNKNNFKLENSIIQTFVMSQSQTFLSNKNREIKEIIEGKDKEYLKKLMDNIKFSQSFIEKSSKQNLGIERLPSMNENGSKKQEQTSQELQFKSDQVSQVQYAHPLLPQYIHFLNNMNVFG